jgi:hypothetical protein
VVGWDRIQYGPEHPNPIVPAWREGWWFAEGASHAWTREFAKPFGLPDPGAQPACRATHAPPGAPDRAHTSRSGAPLGRSRFSPPSSVIRRPRPPKGPGPTSRPRPPKAQGPQESTDQEIDTEKQQAPAARSEAVTAGGIADAGRERGEEAWGWELPAQHRDWSCLYTLHTWSRAESPAQAWRRSCRPAEGPTAACRAPKALLAGETPACLGAHHLPKMFARKACRPLGPLGSSSSQHRRTPELVL